MELSQKLLCPGDVTHRLPDARFFLILTEGPVSVSKRRLQALRQVDELAASLEDEEVRVRAGMDSAVREVKELRAAPVQRFGNLSIRGLQGLSGLCWSEIAAPGLSGLGGLQAGSLGALWVEVVWLSRCFENVQSAGSPPSIFLRFLTP